MRAALWPLLDRRTLVLAVFTLCNVFSGFAQARIAVLTPPEPRPYSPGPLPLVPADLPSDDLRTGGDPSLPPERMPLGTKVVPSVAGVKPIPPLTGIGEQFLHRIPADFAGGGEEDSVSEAGGEETEEEGGA